MVGAAVRVRLLVPVRIRSFALSMVTALATVRLDPSVNALFPSAKAVTLKAAALVRVALAVNVRLTGAVKVLPVVFRVPLRIRVLPVKSKVPLLAVPCKVIFPPLLVI